MAYPQPNRPIGILNCLFRWPPQVWYLIPSPRPLFLVPGPHRRRVPHIENVHPGHDPKVRAIIRNRRYLDFPVPQPGTHHDGALKKPTPPPPLQMDLPFYAHGSLRRPLPLGENVPAPCETTRPRPKLDNFIPNEPVPILHDFFNMKTARAALNCFQNLTMGTLNVVFHVQETCA